jgi:hypothetical protein
MPKTATGKVQRQQVAKIMIEKEKRALSESKPSPMPDAAFIPIPAN